MLVLLLTTGLVPSSAGAATAYSRPITINPGQVPSTQTDFPVLVSLSDNATLTDIAHGGHVANADGSDIYFTDSSGTTEYAYEIEKYDAASGTLVAWVKIPSLANGTTFKIWYGGSGGAANMPSDVWSNGFQGVWHMAQASALDSTANDNNGTAVGGVSANSSGKIDGADSFDGSSGYVNCNNDSHSLDFSNTGQFTLLAWAYTTLPAGKEGGQGVVGKANPPTPGGYEIYLKNSDNSLTIQSGSVAGGGNPIKSATALSANTWHQIAVVYDNGNVSFYIQGSPAGVGSFSSSPLTSDAATNDFHIGFRSTHDPEHGDGLFQGMIDEVEYSNVARSAAWIRTQYNNQSNPGNIGNPGFYTVSDELLPEPYVKGDYSMKGSIKFYDWKGNKAAPVTSGTLHITDQNGRKIEGYWESSAEFGSSDNITVKGYVGPFVRDARDKIKNKPRLSLMAEFGEYCEYPSTKYATYVLNASITVDKKTQKVKSIKGSINGWGEFGAEFTDVGGPSQGQFEGKFTATPVP